MHENKNLTNELRQMIHAAKNMDNGQGIVRIKEDILLQSLVMYIISRDQQVFKHGVHIGKNQTVFNQTENTPALQP